MKLVISKGARRGFARAFDLGASERNMYHTVRGHRVPRGYSSNMRSKRVLRAMSVLSCWEAVGIGIRKAQREFQKSLAG